MPIKISDDELIRLIEPDIKRAEDWAGQLSNERERCDALYHRLPLGNEEEGFSQYVASVVFDTIEWLKPGMIDIFTHPDFFTVQMDDGDQADKLKKLIRYQMFRQQDGAKAIREYVSTALMYHNGIMKTYFDEDKDATTETYDRLTFEQMQQIEADPAAEATLYDEVEESVDGQKLVYFENVKVVRQDVKYRGPRILAVPPWEFLRSPDGTDIDSCSIVIHRQEKTLDEIKRGELAGLYRKGSAKRVDEESVDTLVAPELDAERDRQYTVDGLDWQTMGMNDVYDDDPRSRPNRRYYVDEIYTRLDVDNDGIAEPVIIWRCGDVILHAEENPYGRPPFRSGCLFEVPFRFEGKPLPLMLKDDQNEMTNLRRIYVDASADASYGTMVTSDPGFADEWADRSVGDVITAMKGADHEVIRPDQPGESLLKGIEMVRSDFERRTGVNSLNQGLTADNMGKTATGTVALQNAGQQRQKLYATILGDALRYVIRDFLEINKLWPPQAPVTVRGREVTVIQPQEIGGDSDVQIEVGVGPNDRIQKVQMLEAHFQKLAAVLIPAGAAGPEHLIKTELKIGKLSGSSFDDLVLSPEQFDTLQQMQQQMQAQQQQIQQMQARMQQAQQAQGMPPQGPPMRQMPQQQQMVG
jgi:hypothetical protein